MLSFPINTAQKMEFSADLVIFTEEILNGKLFYVQCDRKLSKVHIGISPDIVDLFIGKSLIAFITSSLLIT